MNKFRSPSRDPTPQPDSGEATEKETGPIKFPPRKEAPQSEIPRSKRTAGARKLAANIHVRNSATLRSPMRSAHRYAFRPLTPTGPSSTSLASAALVSSRPPIQRAASSGAGGIVQSLSMGSVIGPVPKSAKRWARSAHLHEVKSTTALSQMNGSSTTSSIAEKGSDTDLSDANMTPVVPNEVVAAVESGGLAGDVFSTDVRAPAPWTPAVRKESLTMHLARAGLSPSDMSPSRRAAASKVTADVVPEADVWVDTDVDSSDAENGEVVVVEDIQ